VGGCKYKSVGGKFVGGWVGGWMEVSRWVNGVVGGRSRSNFSKNRKTSAGVGPRTS
jgi:hypothetical protein